MSGSFVRDKFGYVEKVENEYQYKNIDYRDTLVPLWNTLYNNHLNSISQNSKLCNDQNEINLALCATLIQLGKSMKHDSDYYYNRLQIIERSIGELEKRLFSLETHIDMYTNDKSDFLCKSLQNIEDLIFQLEKQIKNHYSDPNLS